MSRSVRISAVLLAASVLALGPFTPDVHWVTVSRFEFGGGTGRVASIVAGLAGQNTERVEKVYLSGNRLRTDDDATTTVVDLDAETVTEINHESETYFVVTFEQFRAATRAAMDMVRGMAASPDEQPAAQPETYEEPDVVVTFDVAVDDAGESREFFGVRAERRYVTLTSRVTKTAGDDPDGDLEEEGSIVFFADVWLVDRLPGQEEMEDFNQRQLERMWEGLEIPAQDAGEALAAVTAAIPGFAEGMAKMKEATGQLDGRPVQTVTYVVSVPGGAEFDRDAALGVKKEGKKSRLGGLARGLMGKARGKKDEPPAEEQKTMFRTTTEVTKVDQSALADDLFSVPPGYTRVEGAR